MADLTVVFWRDIPAQIIVKAGRKTAKRELASRFQEAIDAAAMRAKAIGTDAYLEDWQRRRVGDVSTALEDEADAAVSRIEEDYDAARLASLVANKGHEDAG